MEIEYQASKKDYINYYKLSLRASFQKKLAVIGILLFFWVSAVCAGHFTWFKCLSAIITYGIFIVLVSYLIPLLVITIKLNKLLKDNAYLAKRTVIITDKGLESRGENFSLLRIWESFTSVGLNEKFVYLKLADKKNIIIPKRFFLSDADATNFLALIQSKIPSGNFRFENSPQNHSKAPPYKLGFLCLIPLVGAIVGVVLVLYGIFTYKDRRLVFIGLAGIFFTIGVYGSLFYFGFKSDFAKQNFSEIDKRQLNTLFKEIEFYKMQNGTYPDSLQQLDLKDEFIYINDPLLAGKKNDHYNYHKVGNKYILFSSGVDRIPNTDDDVYPSISIDTNKTGLIIKKN